jgi:hypothetical protein
METAAEMSTNSRLPDSIESADGACVSSFGEQSHCNINHEGYQDSLFAMIAESRKQAEVASKSGKAPLRYLERETWFLTAIDGTPVRIIGATLWTDFELFGAETRFKAIAHAYERNIDYLYIKRQGGELGGRRRVEPDDTSLFHRLTKDYFAEALTQAFDGITIVVTHHAPSARSLPDHERDDFLAACYASHLDAFIEEFQPELLVHGHVHESNDYRIGRTRIVSNPRGYAPGHANPSFDPAFVVEV